MSFLVDVAGLVLRESFGWRLTCHSDVQTFQHALKLWIGLSESPVFGENTL